MFWRIVAGLGAILAVVTGIGTVFGWMRSGSFHHASAAAWPWVSRGILLVVAIAVVIAAVESVSARFARDLSWLAGICGIAVGFGIALIPDSADPVVEKSALWALIGCCAGFLHGAWRHHDVWRWALQVTKKCPECAETIKRDARVCRFCNFRFSPPATSVELQIDP